MLSIFDPQPHVLRLVISAQEPGPETLGRPFFALISLGPARRVASGGLF